MPSKLQEDLYQRGVNLSIHPDFSWAEKVQSLLDLLFQSSHQEAEKEIIKETVERDSSSTLKELSRLKAENDVWKSKLNQAVNAMNQATSTIKELQGLIRKERTVNVSNVNPKIVQAILKGDPNMVLDLKTQMFEIIHDLGVHVPDLKKVTNEKQLFCVLHLGFSELDFLSSITAKDERDVLKQCVKIHIEK